MLNYFFGLTLYIITMAALVRLISLSYIYCIPIKLFSCLYTCSFICCPILLCTIFLFMYLSVYSFLFWFIIYLLIYLCTYLSMFTSGDLLSLPHSFAAQPLTPSFVRFETPTLTPQTEVKALPLWLAFLCCTAQSELHNSHEPRTLPKLGMEFCS